MVTPSVLAKPLETITIAGQAYPVGTLTPEMIRTGWTSFAGLCGAIAATEELRRESLSLIVLALLHRHVGSIAHDAVRNGFDPAGMLAVVEEFGRQATIINSEPAGRA